MKNYKFRKIQNSTDNLRMEKSLKKRPIAEKNGQKQTNSVQAQEKHENKTKKLNSFCEIEDLFKKQNKVQSILLNSKQKMHIY